jgi:hypothetical protein
MLLLSLLLLLLLCAVFLAWLCVGVLYLTLMGFPPPGALAVICFLRCEYTRIP